MIIVPEGSLYFWCYTMGLKHVDIRDIENAVAHAGKNLRKKDIDNYWNGWFRSDLYLRNEDSVWKIRSAKSKSIGMQDLSEFETLPCEYILRDVESRWVPCNKNNKPMVKWGNGCMSMVDATSWPGQTYLAENNKGVGRVIIDCDGDHGERLDIETIMFLSKYVPMTHTLYKEVMVCDVPGYEETAIHEPVSFHLSFTTVRIIPTMHFPKAGIDIIGNKENSLRYIKNKKWNNLPMIPITHEIWNDISRYIERRNT